eukprot:1053816-Prorocentrum_minimum.AAC.1
MRGLNVWGPAPSPAATGARSRCCQVAGGDSSSFWSLAACTWSINADTSCTHLQLSARQCGRARAVSSPFAESGQRRPRQPIAGPCDSQNGELLPENAGHVNGADVHSYIPLKRH